ncbi:rRNA pseudouridine synthase [Mycoplasma sp. Pen4]|uniref:pseudouridine synthase n=1 Tax=Mycoplasma sp. Pen4 TaxID=640330 RepID=UPI001654806C|nr:pseudouridine synthase [Mycoplasma sp. Pen4]QNM93800.1 rRNA pseudouridine synthase [Mycoplasma sp. Pen4]
MKQERLDKYLAFALGFTRSEVKKVIKDKLITVNGELVNTIIKVDPENDEIRYDGEFLENKDKKVYMVMNKAKDCVCANWDNMHETVFEYLYEEDSLYRDLHTVGRLDLDTTGILLITNDGKFTHKLVAPKKHVEKKYKVTLDKEFDAELIKYFEKGFEIDENEVVKPSKIKVIEPNVVHLTLTEGKYHQVKRMMAKFDYTVVELERIEFSFLKLNELNLKLGEYRYLTNEEVKELYKLF